MTNNPLSQFYRKPKFNIKIPSRGVYYSDGVVDLDDEKEVSILPMTASDEITLKNPDALLSGKAVVEVLKSCVPAVKEPRKLLACDIDALMIAVRRASYGDAADMQMTCPKCKAENHYDLDLEVLLNQSETLDDNYHVVLPGGLTAFLRPGTFDTMTKQNKAMFENSKVRKALGMSNITDDAAVSILSKAFKTLSQLNFELIADAIQKIVFTEDGEEITVTDKNHIQDFLKNIDKPSVDIIDDKLVEINKIGVARSIQAVCTSCEHKWEAPIEFNPVNFS